MAASSPTRDRLVDIVKTRSFSSGSETRLVSGRSSHFYFNMKPTMLDAEGISLIATLILDALCDRHVDFIGGLEMGSVPLAVAVSVTSLARQRPVSAFFVRKEAKDHGARKLIEGLAPGETLRGKRIVILEDVTTTGNSAMRAIEAVKAEGALIDQVISVVDRLEGAAENFKRAGIPFSALLTIADFR